MNTSLSILIISVPSKKFTSSFILQEQQPYYLTSPRLISPTLPNVNFFPTYDDGNVGYSTQFQAPPMEEYGNFQYGYSNIRQEEFTYEEAGGVTPVRYPYVEPYQFVQTTVPCADYIADHFGTLNLGDLTIDSSIVGDASSMPQSMPTSPHTTDSSFEENVAQGNCVGVNFGAPLKYRGPARSGKLFFICIKNIFP